MSQPPDREWMYCPVCESETPAEKTYCVRCGAPLDPSGGHRHRLPPDQRRQNQSEWSIRTVALALMLGGIGATVMLGFMFGLATSVLDGNPLEQPPDTSFNYSYVEENQTVKVQVEDGETFDPVRIHFEGEQLADPGAPWNAKDPDARAFSVATPGDSVVIEVTGDDYLIEVVWESQSGEKESVISTSTGPGRQAPE